jgi:hypothetical protein
MTLFITNDVDNVYDCIQSGLKGREQLAFVCINADQEPTLIIFAEHFQRYGLANILRSTAAQITEAIPSYDGIIKL